MSPIDQQRNTEPPATKAGRAAPGALAVCVRIPAGSRGGMVSLGAAARLFDVDRRTWTEWQKSGRVHGLRSGKYRLYSLDELQHLKEEIRRSTEPRPDPDRPGCYRVPITGDLPPRREVIIDADSLLLVVGPLSNGLQGSQGARNGTVVMSFPGRRQKAPLHQLIMGVRGMQFRVGHLNGDPLDCRRANLVVRTAAQQRATYAKFASKAGCPSSSRFKGVTWMEQGRKWAAQIITGRKARQLGRFRSEIDAALAYDSALRELHGEHARLNFPDPAEAQRQKALEPPVAPEEFPPAGWVEVDGACALFGISRTTWVAWKRRGKVPGGKRVAHPTGGVCVIYPAEELSRLRVEFAKLGQPYPDPDRPGCWRVPLSGYLDYREAIIDEASVPLVRGRNWNWTAQPGAVGGGEVILATDAGPNTPLRRVLAQVVDNPEAHVSHANGDALDCRRENLVVRSLQEQVWANRKMGTVNGRKYASAFKGVAWDASRGKWLVRISKDAVGKHLGRFDSETDAATAYDAAARVLFGEHGHLNFPDRPSTEQAMADARAAMDSAANQKRAGRRRQRDIERHLRQAAAEALQLEHEQAEGPVAMLSRRVAEQLFDIPRGVWGRWQRFGWLPASAMAQGHTMYPLAAVQRLLLRCGIVALPYPDPERPGVWRVPLAGQTAQGRWALIDADAVPLVQARRWHLAERTRDRPAQVQTVQQDTRLHQVVMGVAGRELLVGFRNGDPLDCRRENLLVRDQGEAHAAHRKQSTFCGQPCTSRFKGVCWPKGGKHWVATITKDRVQRRLGRFRDEIAAAQAYDEAARELFGEHAKINFPDGVDAWLERAAA